MKVQECGEGLELLDMPDDPQGVMIARCKMFQQRVGTWDTDISMTVCRPHRALHHLDMCAQEVAEAWDLVEGGWKHHKKNPNPPNADELLMEMVDVAHFVYNAYLYMGGQAEQELVARAVGQAKESIQFPKLGFETAWAMGQNSWKKNQSKILALYGHGQGAHGEDWEKEVAAILNFLRARINGVTETMRGLLETMTVKQRDDFPAASGYVFIDVVPWMYLTASAIPGCTQQVFYSAFIKKNDINFKRQDEGY